MTKQPIPLNQTLKLPDIFRNLGVTRGFEPCPCDELRFMLEALPGQGKTQFIMSMPGVCVLDFDLAGENAIKQSAHRVHIRTWDDFIGIKTALIEDRKSAKSTWQRVGFDTVDSFLRLLDRHLTDEINERREGKSFLLDTITEFGQGGAGYNKLAMAVLREVLDFQHAGYPWVMNCHMRERRHMVGETQIVERRHKMPPTCMDVLLPLADLKARMYRSMDTENAPKVKKTVALPDGSSKEVEVPDPKATLKTRYWLGVMPQTAEESDNDTKRRIPEMKTLIEIPLVNGYQAFKAEYEKAAKHAAELEKE